MHSLRMNDIFLIWKSTLKGRQTQHYQFVATSPGNDVLLQRVAATRVWRLLSAAMCFLRNNPRCEIPGMQPRKDPAEVWTVCINFIGTDKIIEGKTVGCTV